MSNPLYDYIKSLLPHLKKDDILEDLRVTKGEFENHRKTFDHLINDFAELRWTATPTADLSKAFYRNYKSSVGKTVSLPIDVAKTVGPILLNLDVIEKELEAVLGADVLNEGLSAKKAVLIRGCEHLAFLSRYMLDLINYVLCAETMPKNGTLEQMLSKASMDYVESNVIIFATLLSIYSRPVDTFKKQLLEIPDVIMTQANNGAVTAVHDMAKLDPYSNPMVRQFRGSPIYHIRLIFAEWQANRYKAAKDKRQMLELRLLQLKVLQEEVQDPGLERQIQYLQNRIDKLDRTLEEMER